MDEMNNIFDGVPVTNQKIRQFWHIQKCLVYKERLRYGACEMGGIITVQTIE
jgi:hypothetical protein